MIKAKYTEWIDNYLEGDLEPAEQLSFEAELQVNSQLAMELRLENDLQDILRDEDILDFKAKCIASQQEVNLQHLGKARIIQIARKYWYAAASVVIILLVAGGMFLLNPGSYTNERLFKMYYKSSEVSVSRSGNVNMVEALISFSKKDYASADLLFDKILVAEPANYAVMYYSGISNIELDNFDEAIEKFTGVIENGQNLYVENAQWYLGLAYLIDNQKGKALDQFGIIASKSDHYYNSQAISILEKLNKNDKNKEILNNLFFLILPF